MISLKTLLENIGSRATPGSTSNKDAYRLIAAMSVIDRCVFSVEDTPDLPDPALNKGRLAYVNADADYYVSNGEAWVSDFSSVYEVLDSVLHTVGSNNVGALGNDESNLILRSSPTMVDGAITDWTDVSAGRFHALALSTASGLLAWGQGTDGRLGDGGVLNRSSPVSVAGALTGWTSVSCGLEHSCGVASGVLWSWGSNYNGCLGHDDVLNKSSPVSVVGGFTDWVEVSCGGSITIARRTDNTAWTWGHNTYGSLGHDDVLPKSSPVSVVGGFTTWSKVSAGEYSCGGILADGTLWAWGKNSYGQLGHDDVLPKSSPVSVVGGFTDWEDLSVGWYSMLGKRTNNTLWAWGWNSDGQLGDGAAANKSSPVSVIGGFTDWAFIECNFYNCLGTRTDGSLWTWGLNSHGQLGHNDIISKSSPVSVNGGFVHWESGALARNFGMFRGFEYKGFVDP